MESVQLLVLVLMWNQSSGSLLQNQTKTRFSPFLPPTLTRFSHPVLPVLLHVSSVFRRVERRFLSVTIDSSLASEEKFMSLLGSPKVRTLARALSPAFLRFGGTRQDFMEFSPIRRGSSSSAEVQLCPAAALLAGAESEEEWSRQQILLKRKICTGSTRGSSSQSTRWICCTPSLTARSGSDLRLNVSSEPQRTSGTAATLDLCCSTASPEGTRWMGAGQRYEKKAGVRVDGFQLGKDFAHLRAMMSQSKLYRHAGLYGPDVGQPRNHRTDILQGYYVNGRDTSLEDFLDPDILDTLTLKTLEVLEKVKQVSPEKPVWLGDELCVRRWSRRSVGHLRRRIHDFWLSVLYKRLVGPEVLKVEFSGLARSKRVRLYLHCANTRSFSSGAVTLISLNLGPRTLSISSPLFSSGSVEAFVLESGQPGEEGLISRSVKLNGKMLLMPDDETLPDLTGTRLPPAERLQIPGFSLGFFVLKEARAAACR
ncbi:hypothetical protein F7725_014913 [Dissostichus mawsoni]|uniref:Heparanase n=1 Tax=Dissostichus mawsoni TaxID=36200 RepID=A0A7J5YG10_DISMA|nr:hypothetical protein F7725_014913 [Dissostichus mawsoni]